MALNDDPTRRRVLQVSAGVAVIGLAGCLGAPATTANQGGSGVEDGHDDHSHEATKDHDEAGHHAHSPTEHQSGHGHSHDEGVPEPADAVRFQMTTTEAGVHFEPHVLRLNVGGIATWVNESGSHSATAYHPDNGRPLLMPEDAEAFDSGLLTEPGAEFEQSFDNEGVYHFFCLPHESAGMLGSLIVGDPDPHDEPALGEIPTSLPEGTRRKIEHLNEKCNEALGHVH